MSHQDISLMQEGDRFESFYALRDANLRTSSRGSLYVDLVLADATGTLPAKMWDATQEIFQAFAGSPVVKVRGEVESYRGTPQGKVTAIRTAEEFEFDPALFVATTEADIHVLQQELLDTVASVEDEDYRHLLEAFFHESELMEHFCRAPAARENHHAYVGGLLEHTLSLVHLANAVCSASPTPLNRDLLITGALLHDIGKVEELSVKASIEYTDKGKLIGHLVIGAMMVESRATLQENFPDEKKWLVMHLILSHHGKREYGSPILPAVPEALALHHIDNLDAKTVAAFRLINEDANDASRWTPRSWMLETQLYKHKALPDQPAGDDPDTDAEPDSASPAEPGCLF